MKLFRIVILYLNHSFNMIHVFTGTGFLRTMCMKRRRQDKCSTTPSDFDFCGPRTIKDINIICKRLLRKQATKERKLNLKHHDDPGKNPDR